MSFKLIRRLIKLISPTTPADGFTRITLSPEEMDADRVEIIIIRLVLCLSLVGLPASAQAQTTGSDDFNRPNSWLVVPGGQWGEQTSFGGRAQVHDLTTGDPLTGVMRSNQYLTITYWLTSFGLASYSQGVVAPVVDSGNRFQVFVNRRPTGTPWRYGFLYVHPGLIVECPDGCYALKYDGGTNAPYLAFVTNGAQPFQPGQRPCIDHQVDGTLRGLLDGQVIITANMYALYGQDPLTAGNAGIVSGPITSPYADAWDSWTGGQGLCPVE